MGPTTKGTTSKRTRSLPTTSTFQVNSHQRYKLDSLFRRVKPKARIIRFDAHRTETCHHSETRTCMHCVEEEEEEEAKQSPPSPKTTGKTTAEVAQLYIGLVGISPSIDGTLTGDLPYYALAWWPSFSNGRCTEPISPRGFQVSRDLFQAVVSDHMSFEAFLILAYTCDLVATPSSDQSQTTYKILQQKTKVTTLLRKRIEAGESISDQMIMTIFFLLTFDLLDDASSLTHTWDVHLHAITQLANPCETNKALAFRAHLKSRNETYAEYLDWTKKQEIDRHMDSTSSSIPRRRIYPHHPFSDGLVNALTPVPAGFAAVAQTTLVSLDTIGLIQKSCLLNTLSASLSVSMDNDGTQKLKDVAKEVNYRCNDLLLQRKLNQIENILALALSFHCQHLVKHMHRRSDFAPMGLGISTLLSRLSCTFLARQSDLMKDVDLGSSAISNAIIWAGVMLLVTNPGEDHPASSLGKRLLRCSNDYDGQDLKAEYDICRNYFIWPETLPIL